MGSCVYNRAVGRFSATRGGSADLAALLAGAAARAVQEPQGPGLAAAPVPRERSAARGPSAGGDPAGDPHPSHVAPPVPAGAPGAGPGRLRAHAARHGRRPQAGDLHARRPRPARDRPQPAVRHRLPGRAGRPAVQHHHRQPGRRHPHNPAIDTDPPSTRALFTGSLVDGVATVTDRVPALPAGTYSFRRDMHPSTMSGTLVLA
jgi:hypothetical protein